MRLTRLSAPFSNCVKSTSSHPYLELSSHDEYENEVSGTIRALIQASHHLLTRGKVCHANNVHLYRYRHLSRLLLRHRRALVLPETAQARYQTDPRLRRVELSAGPRSDRPGHQGVRPGSDRV